MGFKGTLSPLIGNLHSLTVLSLMGNQITGEIPKELGNLSKLTSLNLENNLLTGEIPSSLGSLSVLQTLDLSGNNLSGNIPNALFNIANFNFTNNSLNCGDKFPNFCTSYIPSQYGSHKPKLEIILGTITSSIILLTLLITLILYNSRNNKSNHELFQDVSGENDRKISLGQIKRFTFTELQFATEDFNENNIIGKGGFAKVYKGTILLDNQKEVKIAVKRLINVQKGGQDFVREIELISVAVHKNLLRLIGFCVTSNERLLVYPYMENLSLAYRLRDLKPGESPLNWSTRIKIASETAQALEYLHENCDPKIIHRDVKAANVLLGTDFEAVVGDFGLAKLVDVRKSSVTTQVRGTMGHIAPEYLSTGRSSEKTDVFGYGIMLLELITGQHSICLNGGRDDDILLLDHVIKLHREERTGEIVDRSLDGDYDINGVERMIRVALLCAQSSPEERPAMSVVVKMLEGEGLNERWEHLEQIDVTRELSRGNNNMVRFRRGNNDVDVDECESLYVAEAIELSGGR